MDIVVVDTEEAPLYHQIARKALHLRELGLSDSAIARHLTVCDKTVRKAINWIQGSKRRVS